MNASEQKVKSRYPIQALAWSRNCYTRCSILSSKGSGPSPMSFPAWAWTGHRQRRGRGTWWDDQCLQPGEGTRHHADSGITDHSRRSVQGDRRLRPHNEKRQAGLISCSSTTTRHPEGHEPAFTKLDHRVTTAESKSAALAAAAANDFDLLISDIGLPDGTGLELMRELLSQAPNSGNRPHRLWHGIGCAAIAGCRVHTPYDQADQFSGSCWHHRTWGFVRHGC